MKASVFDEEIHVRSIGLAENATFAAEREQEQLKNIRVDVSKNI
jgi:hypothetical protein